MSYLLQIHLGPVQAFIAAARRSRDLWYGSWLLSELSKAAARGIADHEGAGIDALIFPAPAAAEDLARGSGLNVSNRILALVAENPRQAAETARQAMDSELTTLTGELAKLTSAKLSTNLRNAVTSWTDVEKQIMHFVEFYWIAVPLGDDYAADRQEADRLLAARKSTRNFEKVTWGSSASKSSLDGARESVIPEADRDNAQKMYELFRAKPRERLSGVDLLKRRGKTRSDENFPSTSHMAALPLEKQLDEKGDGAAWEAYLDKLPDQAREQEAAYHDLKLPLLGDYDGSLLFASRLLEHVERSELGPVEKALQVFLKKSGIDSPNLYYAVLMGDGDFMGRTLNALESAEENQQFSQTLASFAERAKEIVAHHHGAPIFTGGDDVLALLPLHTAVQCATELAGEFGTRMAEYAVGGFGPPTFSAGLAIVHHLEPLEDALELARAAERTAKEFPDKANPQKNALAVALAKRSGVPRMVVGSWGVLDERLLTLAALHQKELIPDGLAYQLLKTYQELGGRTAVAQNPQLRTVLALEAERIIGRKREGSGEKVDEGHKAYLIGSVAEAHTSSASIAEELIIAGLIADVCEMAQVALELGIELEGEGA